MMKKALALILTIFMSALLLSSEFTALANRPAPVDRGIVLVMPQADPQEDPELVNDNDVNDDNDDPEDVTPYNEDTTPDDDEEFVGHWIFETTFSERHFEFRARESDEEEPDEELVGDLWYTPVEGGVDLPPVQVFLSPEEEIEREDFEYGDIFIFYYNEYNARTSIIVRPVEGNVVANVIDALAQMTVYIPLRYIAIDTDATDAAILALPDEPPYAEDDEVDEGDQDELEEDAYDEEEQRRRLHVEQEIIDDLFDALELEDIAVRRIGGVTAALDVYLRINDDGQWELRRAVPVEPPGMMATAGAWVLGISVFAALILSIVAFTSRKR